MAGVARGRRLAAPDGDGTRPTSDKVRGAVFNVLGQFFDGGRVLDLYSGTGALALEALSRGCADATCVDASAARRRGHRPQRGHLRLRREGDRGPAPGRRRPPALPAGSFDLAFVDPPYAEGPGAALEALDRVLRPGAAVVAEHDRRAPPPERVGALSLQDRRAYGDTGISIYRRE